MKVSISEIEINDLTDRIKGGDMNCLFENFEKIDIQAARQTAMEEGRAEGRVSMGVQTYLRTQIGDESDVSC